MNDEIDESEYDDEDQESAFAAGETEPVTFPDGSVVRVPSAFLLPTVRMVEGQWAAVSRGVTRCFYGFQMFALGPILVAAFFAIRALAAAGNANWFVGLMLAGAAAAVIGWLILWWGSSDIQQPVLRARYPLLLGLLLGVEWSVLLAHVAFQVTKNPAFREARPILVLFAALLLVMIFERLLRPLGTPYRLAARTAQVAAGLTLVAMSVWWALGGNAAANQLPRHTVAFYWLGVLILGVIFWAAFSIAAWRLSRALKRDDYRRQLAALFFVVDKGLAVREKAEAEATFAASDDERHRAKPLEGW